MTVEDKYLLREPGYGDTADIKDVNHNTDLIANGMYQNRLMIGKAYDPDREEPYMKDDLVVKQTTVLEDGSPVAYNFEYYKALEDNITGVWDASKWKLTDISTELATKGEGGADVTKEVTGNPVTFTDGASAPLVKCDVTISPIQDLHGYDKPWVGGAGKNKYGNGDQSFTQAKQNIALLTPLSAGTYIFGALVESSDTDNTDCLIQLIDSNGTTLASGRISRGVTNRTYLILSWSGNDAVKLNLYAAASYVNGAGDTASFTDIQIEQGSTATTFAPYSNICPISGYSSVGVNVAGKNLLNKADMSATRNSTWLNDNCVLQPGTYTFSFNSSATSGGCTFNVFNANGDRIYKNPSTINLARKVTHTFTISEPSAKVGSYINEASNISNIMIELGSTATDYEPYNPNSRTYTISLGDTYYSGQIDAVKGVFVGTHGYDEFDGTATVTISHSGYDNWYYTIANGGYAGSNTANVICNKYVGANVTDYTDVLGIRKQASGSVRVRVGGTEPADVSGFLAELTNTHLQLVYPLVTPIEIPLTPTVISSLLGNNTMWTDGDSMEIEYITEEFQPIVDLIESNSGKHVYSTNEQVVGTWTDGRPVYEIVLTGTMGNNSQISIDLATEIGCDMVVDIKGWITATDSTNQIWMHDSYVRFFVQGVSNLILNKNDAGNYGYDNPYTFIIRYTKPSSNTRSLNLTKSAVEEIPDEIKNAEYEEKPETNEADDDAPTEVDER